MKFLICPSCPEQLENGETEGLFEDRQGNFFNYTVDLDEDEMINLNYTYRNLNKTTNVLAFPASYPKDIKLKYPLLGDIIICPTVLLQESKELNLPLVSHWAHIVIHGVLHLLGYDHIKEDDKHIMQEIEIKLLESLGFNNPYETQNEE